MILHAMIWAEAVSAAFEYSKLVLASPTYNGDVFPCMRFFMTSDRA